MFLNLETIFQIISDGSVF